MNGLFDDEKEDESLWYRDHPLAPPKKIPDHQTSLASELNPILVTAEKVNVVQEERGGMLPV